MILPTVIEKTHAGERAYDIYSRLLKDRIIFFGSELNSQVGNAIIAQLLHLQQEDASADITMYVNSPGGSSLDCYAIIDTMNHIKCDVSTVAIGMAASAGALILSSGAKGKRFILPNAQVMIHQPLGGAQGQVTDIEIITKQMLKGKRRSIETLAHNTGQKIDKVASDVERDYWMDAKEAVKYGIVDKIIK